MELEFGSFDHEKKLEEQRALFIECFPETRDLAVSSTDHYYWKFHSKPGERGSVEYSVCEQGEMIGYYAAIPYNYQYGDSILHAAMVCDVMTGVKARGKGVFTRLGKYATSKMAEVGFDVTTGYPIRPEVIPGHLKAGWKIALDLPMYGRIIRFDALLKSKKIGLLAPLANGVYTFFSTLISLPFRVAQKDFCVRVFSSRELSQIENIDAFYAGWQKNIPIALIKDRAFLEWRLNAPQKEYQILVLYHKDQIAGILVATEFTHSGIPCLGVLDLTLSEGYFQKSTILLQEAVRVAKQRNCELVLMMMSPYWYSRYALLKSLFIRTPYKFYLIVKNLSNKVANEVFFKVSNWHLMWIDSDDL